MKRDISVQALRIVCCVFVIGIHITMGIRQQDGTFNRVVLLADAFLRCCVPVFFMITGYFFSKETSLRRMAKNALLRIVVPLVLVLVLLQLLNGLLEAGQFSFAAIDPLRLAQDIFTLGNKQIDNSFYLWFVFDLLIIYLWMPLLRFVCTDTPVANKVRRYLLLLGIGVSFVLPTLKAAFPVLQDYLQLPSVLRPYPLVYFLLGYEMNSVSRMAPKPLGALTGFALYAAGSLFTFVMTMGLDVLPDGELNFHFLRYPRVGVALAALGLFYAFLHIGPRRLKERPRLSWLIDQVGRRTYIIYLLHWPVILVLGGIGFTPWLAEALGWAAAPVFVLLVFLVTLGIAVLVHLLISAVKRGLRGLVYKKRPLPP